MHYLFWITCFGFAASTGTALLSSDEVMFATLGNRVTLPCAVGSGSQCSSVTWTKDDSPFPLVTAGRVIAPNVTLLRDCSLQICNVHSDNATTFVCDNGISHSSVVLRILNITENMDSAEGKIELDCYLNDYNGLVKFCNKPGILLSWLAEDNTVIKNDSKRFYIKNFTNCFLKLRIQSKLTDHLRKWRCQVSLNGSAKASVSYTTTVAGGMEEVFAAVGESLLLTCPITSSLGLTGKCQTATSVTQTGSTTVVKVSPLHAGEYQCIDKGKTNKMRLHTFDITSELDPQGQNVTLTCVLTCANCLCDKDFNLTWSEDDATYSSLLNVNGSLINKLSIPLVRLGPDETVCSVLREGVQVATKKWHHSETLSPGLAWIAGPIVILCIAVIGIFCVYRKRKRNKYPEHFQTHIGMTHVYEDVKDYEPQCKREAVTSSDSFYDLLQAVN